MTPTTTTLAAECKSAGPEMQRERQIISHRVVDTCNLRLYTGLVSNEQGV